MDTPSATAIVHDRRYLTRDDLEALTPAGRSLHRLEGLAFSVSAEAVRYRVDRDVRLCHDALADAAVLGILPHTDRLLRHLDADVREAGEAVRALVCTYLHHDRQEDAAAARGDARMAQQHVYGRRLAGWIERSCDALRMRARQGTVSHAG